MRHLRVMNDDLSNTAAVSQIQERDTAVVTPAGNPASEGDFRTCVRGSEISGIVGADHHTSFPSLLSVKVPNSATTRSHATARCSPVAMSFI